MHCTSRKRHNNKYASDIKIKRINYLLTLSIVSTRAFTVTVGGCNLCGRAINYVGVFCRERDFHTLARIVALTTTIAQLRLRLKVQVTLFKNVRAFFLLPIRCNRRCSYLNKGTYDIIITTLIIPQNRRGIKYKLTRAFFDLVS